MNAEELPEGWCVTKVGDICSKVGSGSTPRGGSTAYHTSGVPLIRSMNVRFEGFTPDGLVFLNDKQAEQLKEVAVQEKDVLLNITGASIGRVCMAPGDMAGARVNQHVCILRIAGVVLPEFLAKYLASPPVQEMIWSEEYGVTRQALTKGQILEFGIPTPPMAEQRRIVGTVERLLEVVASARERLERVPSTMKRFRQSVLAAASSGRLTADWREANYADASPALPAYDPDSGSDDVPELPEYPENWSLTSVGDCSELVQYGTSEKADPAGDVPLLRMGNIQEGRIVLDDLKFVNEDLPGLSSLLLERGDLLFNRTNSPELVGKSGVFESKQRVTFASYLIRVRCKAGSIDSRLLCWWLNSPWGREWAAKVRTDGVSQSNINGTKLQQMPILVPPLVEQEEIVRRGTALLALADAIEQKAISALRRVELLTQAILARAFRGELVPTEAELARNEGRSYEPANELLARLKTSVNGESKGTRGKRASKRSNASEGGMLEFMEG